jgi:hypothetical protein
MQLVSGSSLRSDLLATVSDELASYLSEERSESVVAILGTLPRPTAGAEVLDITPPLESGECVSVTQVSGPHEEVLCAPYGW